MKYTLLACMLVWNVAVLCDSRNPQTAPDTPYTRMLAQRAQILNLPLPTRAPSYMKKLTLELKNFTAALQRVRSLPKQTVIYATE